MDEINTEMAPSPSCVTSNIGMEKMKYVPQQVQGLANLSTAVNEGSPLYQMARDFLVLIKSIPYIPNIFLPLRTKEPADEFYLSSQNIVAKVPIVLVSIIELLVILLTPILLILPIPPVLMLAGSLLLGLFIWLVMRPAQGAKLTMARMAPEALDSSPGIERAERTIEPERFQSERWLFLNGVMTEHIDLQKNVDAIAKVFGRPVLGIHNQSFGFIADLFECVIQRCFSYPTRDGRLAYEAVKTNLLDPNVKKVVLIAHSQGAIEASLVVDRLSTLLPQDKMSKLVSLSHIDCST